MADPVRGLHIPEPCSADWERMRGDAQRRFCGSCSQHVHDLSAMTPAEARAVLAQGRACVRFRQDAAGNVLHAPPRRSSRLARTVALGAALLGAGPAWAAPSVAPASDPATAEAPPTLMARVLARMRAALEEQEEERIESLGQVRMGDVAPEPPPPPLIGRPMRVEPPPPPPPPPRVEPAPGETVIPEVEEALRQR